MAMFFDGRIYLMGETPVVAFAAFRNPATNEEAPNDPAAVITVKKPSGGVVTLTTTWDSDIGMWVGDATPLLTLPPPGVYGCKIAQVLDGHTMVDKGVFELQATGSFADLCTKNSETWTRATDIQTNARIAKQIAGNSCKFNPSTGNLEIYGDVDPSCSGSPVFVISLRDRNFVALTDPAAPWGRSKSWA